MNYKPDTELRGENPFERSDFERTRKGDEPDRKRVKMALPAYMENVSDGVKLSEEELEERRQELLAKAEIQSGETNELDDAAARKILALFEKRLKTNQQLRIKYAAKPEKFMSSEMDLFGLIQDLRMFATKPDLYELLWDESVSGGMSLSNLISLTSHENSDIAAGIIETLFELIDQEEEEYEPILERLVEKYMEFDVLSVAVATLKRMDESKQEEQDAAYTCLHLVNSIIESSADPQISTKAAQSSNLILWLLKRVRSRSMTSIKIFAGELLSILLQDSEENRKTVGEADGVDILLKQLANFKKKDPRDKEEIELMENLFNSLCSVLQFVPNRKKFIDGEGMHLMNLMVKEKKMSRNSALKVINHAVSGKEGKENCEKFVEIYGLRSFFPLFMKPPKRNKKTGHTDHDHEEALMSILGNLLRNLEGSVRERLINKFIEADHAKTDRLLELHFKYLERIELADEEIQKQARMLAQEGQEMDEDMLYIQKLEKGLFTLQQIDYVIVELYGTGIQSLKDRIMTHLSMRKSSLRQIREIVKEYADNLGDGEDPEAEEAERQRLLALAMSL